MFLIRKPVKVVRDCSEHGETWYTMEFVSYSVKNGKILIRLSCDECESHLKNFIEWEYFEVSPMTFLRLLVQLNENYNSSEQ